MTPTTDGDVKKRIINAAERLADGYDARESPVGVLNDALAEIERLEARADAARQRQKYAEKERDEAEAECEEIRADNEGLAADRMRLQAELDALKEGAIPAKTIQFTSVDVMFEADPRDLPEDFDPEKDHALVTILKPRQGES